MGDKKVVSVDETENLEINVIPTNEITELEALKAELAELKAEKPKTVSKSTKEWLNERVPFKAHFDGEKYKDDIVVGINGSNYVIQRGKTVMIPRYVYMALDDSDRQDNEATSASQKLSEQFLRDTNRRL